MVGSFDQNVVVIIYIGLLNFSFLFFLESKIKNLFVAVIYNE
jgi:hypothetical protein